ncbi:MAG: hypothetical protein QXP31_00405 [Pyrobaculum sp.]
MYILTERYSSLPLPSGCVKLIGGVPIYVKERCAGAYLVKKEGGVYAERRPAKVGEVFEVYVAWGPPRRYIFSPHGSVSLDGLDLFRGFKKRGLWKELVPSFYAAVAAYASKCAYCAAFFELAEKPGALGGRAIRVAKAGGRWHVEVVTPPGRSEEFKQAALAVFKTADFIYYVRLGGPVDVALDAYLATAKKPAYVTVVAPAPALRSLAKTGH